MSVNSLPKTVTRQHLGCDLNSGPSAPESSTLTTRLLSHPSYRATHLISIALLINVISFCLHSGYAIRLAGCSGTPGVKAFSSRQAIDF